MKILLVEANYKTSILSFALQKFAGKYLAEGHEVRFQKGVLIQKGFFENWYPDKIYVTSLFTYHGNEVIKTINAYKKAYPKAEIHVGGIFATLMPEYVYEQTGIYPTLGIVDEFESAIPDFSIFPETKRQTLFTSRGCIRKCGFCAVKRLEPEFYIHPTWKEQFNPAIPHILIQDNNIIASPIDHQRDVVDFLSKLGKNYVVDFNGGFDCRIFTEEHAELYKTVNIPIVRFAFDNTKSEDGYIQKAIKLAHSVMKSQKVIVYTLYNYLDSPEDLYYRLKECISLYARPYAMRYMPLDALDTKYVGPNWTKQQARNFRRILLHLSWGTMCIHPFTGYVDRNIEIFNQIFGKDEKEFVEILNRRKKAKIYAGFKVKLSDKKGLMNEI